MEHRGLLGYEATLYGATEVGTCNYTLVQTHRMKSEPWCKLWALGDDDMST